MTATNSIRLRRSRAVTTLETVVAFTLLTAILSVSAPLLVKHARLATQQRHYRLALDELSNQIERLTLLPDKEIQPALDRLQPSEFATAQLSTVKLHGHLHGADFGRRLVLTLTWGEAEQGGAAISLAAWIAPASGESNQTTRSNTP
jgi:hypothetical protein